jgi:hypothetical protein
MRADFGKSGQDFLTAWFEVLSVQVGVFGFEPFPVNVCPLAIGAAQLLLSNNQLAFAPLRHFRFGFVCYTVGGSLRLLGEPFHFAVFLNFAF